MRPSQRHQTSGGGSQKAERPTSHAEKRLEKRFSTVAFIPFVTPPQHTHTISLSVYVLCVQLICFCVCLSIFLSLALGCLQKGLSSNEILPLAAMLEVHSSCATMAAKSKADSCFVSSYVWVRFI